MKHASHHHVLHHHAARAADDTARLERSAIIARFQAQEVINGVAMDAGEPQDFDVTAEVLILELRKLRQLADNTNSTDSLVLYQRHMHDGIYRVEVVAQICRYLGVNNLKQVQEQQLHIARKNFYAARRAGAAITPTFEPLPHCTQAPRRSNVLKP